MGHVIQTHSATALVSRTRSRVREQLCRMPLPRVSAQDLRLLGPGKMLRTRFAARLHEEASLPVRSDCLTDACVAVELVHTASLCHDDVIDGAQVRRAAPALWRRVGPSAAVLVGDMLLCEAIGTIIGGPARQYGEAFLARIREMCLVESEHEMSLLGRRLEPDTCVRLARGKTGALFAFLGLVCGGEDEPLAGALQEVGYRIGAAYQLADDLLDRTGDEEVAGKTLGSDAARGKFTLPQSDAGTLLTQERMVRLCEESLNDLLGWPGARAALESFLIRDLDPPLSRLVPSLGLARRLGLRP